jgi:hypothetical protein
VTIAFEMTDEISGRERALCEPALAGASIGLWGVLLPIANGRVLALRGSFSFSGAALAMKVRHPDPQ